jgi:hypothetical protein
MRSSWLRSFGVPPPDDHEATEHVFACMRCGRELSLSVPPGTEFAFVGADHICSDCLDEVRSARDG